MLKFFVKKILSSFYLIITQTQKDADRFLQLGALRVIPTDNIKYSAHTLPCDEKDLSLLQQQIGNRPLWVYASTHDGEESLACAIHDNLKASLPDLLTIIVPRHPERRGGLKDIHPALTFRGANKTLPDDKTEIYIADTLGELGLFYTLCPIAMIGRSFSHDGGGGHNPIEAAQLDCAIMTGPHIQYQKEIFDALINANAAIQVQDKHEFEEKLLLLLTDKNVRKGYQKRATDFAVSKNKAVDDVIELIKPFLPVGQRHV